MIALLFRQDLRNLTKKPGFVQIAKQNGRSPLQMVCDLIFGASYTADSILVRYTYRGQDTRTGNI